MKANRYYVGQLYHAIRTLEVHKVFVDVFAGQRSRLVLVMGGAMQHAFHSKSHIYAINNSACNPHGIKPDAYAIAPYVGITANPGSSTLFADLLGEQLKDRIATVKEKSIDVGQTSMKLIAYEGGQHLTHSDSRSVAPQKDPRMGALYKVMLDSLANYLTHFNHYVHMGGTWGAKANIGDPDNISPKYVQLREWSKKYHPTSSIIPHRLTPVGTSAMVYKNKNGTVMYTLLGKRVSAVNPTTAFQPFVKNLHLGIQNRVELWVE
jgi:hypothetical protein